MKTLTIKDLSATETLDSKAMGAVRGGMFRFMPAWGPSYRFDSKSISKSASQLIGQTQIVSNANGNNVAFADHIHSTVNPTQSANNSINF